MQEISFQVYFKIMNTKFQSLFDMGIASTLTLLDLKTLKFKLTLKFS